VTTPTLIAKPFAATAAISSVPAPLFGVNVVNGSLVNRATIAAWAAVDSSGTELLRINLAPGECRDVLFPGGLIASGQTGLSVQVVSGVASGSVYVKA
jgi:hypothetical protein